MAKKKQTKLHGKDGKLLPRVRAEIDDELDRISETGYGFIMVGSLDNIDGGNGNTVSDIAVGEGAQVRTIISSMPLSLVAEYAHRAVQELFEKHMSGDVESTAAIEQMMLSLKAREIAERLIKSGACRNYVQAKRTGTIMALDMMDEVKKFVDEEDDDEGPNPPKVVRNMVKKTKEILQISGGRAGLDKMFGEMAETLEISKKIIKDGIMELVDTEDIDAPKIQKLVDAIREKGGSKVLDRLTDKRVEDRITTKAARADVKAEAIARVKIINTKKKAKKKK